MQPNEIRSDGARWWHDPLNCRGPTMSDESPTERIHEDILDQAHEARERWINWAAATAAILAGLAAISSTLGDSYLTKSSRAQIQSNDQWSYYQAKSIKSSILHAKLELLEAAGKSPSAADRAKLDEYEHDLDALKTQAEQSAAASEANLVRHEVLQRGVTLFHIAIAVVAIAVLTRLRSFWYLSIAAGMVGVVFFVQGLCFG
jgi:Domain of unknown function (DUF4337)